MKPEAQARSRSLFDGALPLPRAERGRYLLEHCGDDPVLRREVEELLELAEQGDGPLDRSPVPVLRSGSEHLVRGDRLGRYTIDCAIGEGGMGVVYRARQEEPARDVAVKVVHDGLLSRGAIRRFAQEAAVLGRLQHPGIAAVIEASLTGGRPFIAMELVEGETITRYAEERSLGLRGRLELVAKVCDALHHAHVRGVIHRDIKPGNILVDRAGGPRVLDFGIARLTEADTGMGTMTGAGQMIGTLAYMSPEQTGGDPTRVDARSDVYSLGVVLYEMVCGRVPVQVNELMIADAVVRIQTEDPVRPGTVVPSLPREVDTIILRALEKDPQNRYQHASELAADIRRFLADEPILAIPQTTWYQARKFAKRNRLLVTAVGLTVCAVLAALGGVTAAMLRAKEAEAAAAEQAKVATAEAERAERFSNFLRSMLQIDRGSIAGRDTAVLRKMLERAEARLPSLEKDGHTRAAILAVIGNTYRDFGFPAEAQRLLAEAVEVSTRIKGAESFDTLFARDALAAAKCSLSDFPGAESDLRQILAIRERVDPDAARRAVTASNLAVALQGLRRYEEATEYFRKAAAFYGEAKDDDARLGAERAAIGLLSYLGRPEEAERAISRALDEHQRRYGWAHPETVAVLIDWGCFLRDQGRTEEAYAEMRRSLDLCRQVHGEQASITLGAMDRLSGVCMELSKWSEAESLMLQLRSLLGGALGEDSLAYWGTHMNIGAMYRQQERAAEAEEFSAAAVSGFDRVAPGGCVFTGHALAGHSETLRMLERRGEEVVFLERAWRAYAEGPFADPARAAEMAGLLADAYGTLGDQTKAELWRGRAATPEPPPGGHGPG
ncbi:MAG: protein kinase domain-containing protein [Phycisphaerales bacterium]